MPGVGDDLALILAADADAVGPVDKQVAVVGIGRFGLQQPAPLAVAGRREHHVHDQRVLVDLGTAAVGAGPVGHDVTLGLGGGPEGHHLGRLAADGRIFEGRDGGRITEVLQSSADGGVEVAVEVPLASDDCRIR